MNYRRTLAALALLTTVAPLPAMAQATPTPTAGAPAVETVAQDPLLVGRQLRIGVARSADNPLLVPDFVAARAAFEQALTRPGAANADAQLSLGKMLLIGEGGAVDLDRGMDLLQQAMRAGRGEAAYVLGNQLLLMPGREADGVSALQNALRLGYPQAGLALAAHIRPADAAQADSLEDLSVTLLKQAAVTGDASAAFALGEFYRTQGTPAAAQNAIDYYKRAFALGNERGLYWQARLEADKTSPLANAADAAKLYDQAAARGSVTAARELLAAATAGTLPVDKSRGDFWMQKLIEIGDPTAQLLYADQVQTTLEQRKALSDKLYAQLMADPSPDIDVLLDAGSRFRDGNALVVDVSRALDLFARGIDRGDKDSVLRYAELVLASPSLQTPDNTKRAYTSIRALVGAGSYGGAVTLADMLAKGIGTPANQAEAVKLYQLAANEAGSVTAMMDLAEIYRASPDLTERQKAFPWIAKAADAGSVSALMSLAEAYNTGDIIARDRLKAVDLYQKAIDAGAGTALDALSALYLQTGGDAAMDLARNVYERAIRNSYPDAAIKYANFLVRTGQAQQAIPILEKPEFSDRVDVALALSQLYTTGQAGVTDLDKAKYWLGIAADKVSEDPKQRIAVAGALLNSPDAANQVKAVAMLDELAGAKVPAAGRFLGQAYFAGKGVAADPEKAVASYMGAIALGDPDARIELADVYANGVYVPADVDRAVNLYQEALAQTPDDANANLRLGRLYAGGRLGAGGLTTAIQYYQRAAATGNSSAQLALGNAYLWGAGVTQDTSIAEKWLRSAVDAGSIDATASLAALHTSAIAADVDPAAAFAYNYQAAKKNYVPAMIEVGVALVSGFGVAKDADAGITWFEKAADFGSNPAMYDLYQIYADGNGVPKSPKDADAWLTRAAGAGNGSAMYQLALKYLATKQAPDHDKAVALLQQGAAINHNQSRKMLVKLGLIAASDAEED
ncbi:MAG TPA: hypothetical protein VGM83_21760 [Devosiaceae bacterium]|jgi:hypothetical protein